MDLLGAIRSLQKITDLGSFSRAARELGVLPSTLTRQIDALEARLGAVLVQRSTRHVALTESGRLYLERAAEAVRSLDEAGEELAVVGRAPQGVLRVALPQAFGQRHVIPLLPEFSRRHPAVKLTLFFSDKLVDFERDGIDLAIRVGATEQGRVIVRKLLGTRRLLCASPGYLQAQGVPRDPEALEKHNCLVYRYHHGKITWYLRRGGRLTRVVVDGNVSADSGEAIHQLALADCGIGLLPDWMIESSLRSGALVTVLPDYEATVSSTTAELGVFAVYPPSRRTSVKVRALVGYLSTALDQPGSPRAPRRRRGD
jgi:DNA-binding transcriptional LysR family regulator